MSEASRSRACDQFEGSAEANEGVAAFAEKRAPDFAACPRIGVGVSTRVALVTGGARGIGAAVCRALCDQGAAVVVADLRDELAGRTAAELTAAGHRAIGVAIDVTDGESVVAALAVARSELGEIDVLVNYAGWDELRPFVDTDEAFWERIDRHQLPGRRCA